MGCRNAVRQERLSLICWGVRHRGFGGKNGGESILQQNLDAPAESKCARLRRSLGRTGVCVLELGFPSRPKKPDVIAKRGRDCKEKTTREKKRAHESWEIDYECGGKTSL